MYANEARIVWNALLQHEADAFLKESLDYYFGPDKKRHFLIVDKQGRKLVTITLKVIDMKLKETSRIFFLT